VGGEGTFRGGVGTYVLTFGRRSSTSGVDLPERRSEGNGAIATLTERRPEVTVSTKEGRNAPKGITTDWSRNIVSELTVERCRVRNVVTNLDERSATVG
jgi:hypothetical protein